jgi:hypothetical protein
MICGWHIDGRERCKETAVRGKPGLRMGSHLCSKHLKEYDRRWGGEGALHHDWDGKFVDGEEKVL